MKRINIRIPTDLYNKIMFYANDCDSSFNEYVADVLEMHVAKLENRDAENALLIQQVNRLTVATETSIERIEKLASAIYTATEIFSNLTMGANYLLDEESYDEGSDDR